MAAFLSVSNLSFRLTNGSPLFHNISFTAHKELTTLVGVNGVGKSVLGRCLCGILPADNGTIQTQGRLHYVSQNGPETPGFKAVDLFDIGSSYAAAKQIEQGSVEADAIEQAQAWWERSAELNGHLRTVGLSDTIDLMRPITTFSGGEQFRLMWAAALMARPDGYIFDEPTNHLDRHGRECFIRWLLNEQRPRIIISHDRELLDCADTILELTASELFSHPGNFSQYREEREQRWRTQQRQLDQARKLKKQQEQAAQDALEKQQQRAARGKTHAARTGLDPLARNAMKQAAQNSQGQQKLLRQNRQNTADQTLNQTESQREWSEPITFDLSASQLCTTKNVLSFNGLCSGITEPLHPPISLLLTGPFRLRLEGPNGVGKSVLMKTLLNQLAPLQGRCERFVPTVHLDQHFHHFDSELSAIENLLQRQPAMTVQGGRKQLAHVRLRNDKADVPFGQLSGGEQLKTVLATELLGPVVPQLILLDEPTNHMDLDSVIALEQALSQYEGALIVISHDDTFVQSLRLTHRFVLPSAQLEPTGSP